MTAIESYFKLQWIAEFSGDSGGGTTSVPALNQAVCTTDQAS